MTNPVGRGFRPAVWCVLAWTVMSIWRAPGAAADPTAPGPESGLWLGSPGDSLFGRWEASAAPGQVIHIYRLQDLIVIDCAGRFRAAGFGRTNTFVGLVKPDTSRGAPALRGKHPVLYLARLGPTTLEARFGAELGSPLAPAETWTWIPSGLASPPARLAPTAPYVPAPVTKFPETSYLNYPVAIQRVAPEYPTDFGICSDAEWTISVRALVGVDGRVKLARVLKPGSVLDDSAVDCVRKWRFRPALNPDGTPHEAWVTVPVRYSIE